MNPSSRRTELEMKIEPCSGWRRIVRAYLEACWSDRRANLESAASNCEALALAQHGSESLWLEHYRAAKSHCNTLVPLAPEETYEIIEESAEGVLVQVPGSGDHRRGQFSIPYMVTRVRLVRRDAGWEITGLYLPCIACNFSSVLERFPGRCDHFRGSGTKYGMTSRVRGFWPFARLSAITETCPNCGGTGICPDCKETTDMPGWCRVFSLDGLGLTAGRKIPTDPVSVEE